ncbi:hypothetical protein SLS60_005513 [Paraconiothyrium brasiliense]|uniref:DUF3844 domain-containing protein n=1 Tax=Paraconiothyrium brasiliense TaxID=300254 RepID=A0ABR3RHJ8_9PLEO
MKLSWSFVVSSLYCAASAAHDAHVYVFDPVPRTSPQAATTVDATTARLILAQRLGLSRFHSIEKTRSEESLKQINAFGGRQQKLFGGEDADRTRAHALVWIEGVEDAEAVVKNSGIWSSKFTITNPPAASDNKHLIEDMILQAESLPKKSDPKGATYQSNQYIDHKLSELRQPQLFNDYLTILHIDLKAKDKMAKPSLEKLSDIISSLQVVAPEENRFAITLVVMPSSSSNSKRAANPYGNYDRPSLEARRELTEAPMSLSTSEPATSPNTALPSDLEDFPVIAQADGNDTTPPLGILPRCFESESACTKATNGCSGHGSCGMLHKGKKGERGDCYGCVCKPTVVDRGDTGMEQHKKTTYWGGPACQKKDVSVPFWLFVTSGVLFAFLISGGIGLLYSVGSEELPSVIGAGVSGPVRK